MTNLWHTLVPKPNQTKHIITEFADTFSMVYFGYVSQRDDDHHMIGGMTVSVKHHDDHYCIGTYDNYDVMFVERSDTLKNGKKHIWHIMEFDLKSGARLPHLFIGSNSRTHGFHELMSLKHRKLSEIKLPTATYPESFTDHFTVYAAPENMYGIERLIDTQLVEALASHFKGLVIEIKGDALYIYSEQAQLSKALLETMLKNGRWLAESLDKNSRQL